jgi:ribosome-associated protein
VDVPDDELTFTASRSGGPGGQHVNKVSSRVTVAWDLAASSALSPEQKDVLRRRLGRRVTDQGVLRVSVQDSRSQAANRRLAVERLQALVDAALAPRKPRRATRPTAASRERRLTGKKRRSEVKRGRVGAGDEE